MQCARCLNEFERLYAKGMCKACYMVEWKKKRPKASKKLPMLPQSTLEKMKEYREQQFFDGKRQAILHRDNFTCVACGREEEEKNLTVHHRDGQGRSVDDPNNDEKNLVTLCRSCHLKEHHAELLEIRRKNSKNRWSLHYDACVECGTTEIPYNGKGRCDNCYARYLRQNRTGRWSHKYEACLECGTTDFPYSANGYCSSCGPRLRRQRLKTKKIESSPTA